MERGFSLIESVIYVTIFTLLAGVMTNALYSVASSYRLMQASVTLETVAETALERMARETRDSASIDIANSVFGSSDGVLALNTTDEGGASATLQFFISNQTVHIRENGIDLGPLSSDKARVTKFIFYPINTPYSQAVRMEVTVETGQDASYKSGTFYATVVLRGSYAP